MVHVWSGLCEYYELGRRIVGLYLTFLGGKLIWLGPIASPCTMHAHRAD